MEEAICLLLNGGGFKTDSSSMAHFGNYSRGESVPLSSTIVGHKTSALSSGMPYISNISTTNVTLYLWRHSPGAGWADITILVMFHVQLVHWGPQRGVPTASLSRWSLTWSKYLANHLSPWLLIPFLFFLLDVLSPIYFHLFVHSHSCYLFSKVS